jgi:hypothetical protein
VSFKDYLKEKTIVKVEKKVVEPKKEIIEEPTEQVNEEIVEQPKISKILEHAKMIYNSLPEPKFPTDKTNIVENTGIINQPKKRSEIASHAAMLL